MKPAAGQAFAPDDSSAMQPPEPVERSEEENAIDKASAADSVEPVHVEPQTDPELSLGELRRDRRTIAAETPPGKDETPSGDLLFRAPPRRAASSADSRSVFGPWLAAAFAVLVVLGALVLFRDAVVAAFPGLAPAYAAMGLLVYPSAAAPHG